jgi:hypothetical protein
MFGEIQFELSGIHTILLFLIVGGAMAILFFEIKKLKILVESIIKDKSKKDIDTSEYIRKDFGDIQQDIPKNIPIDVPNGAPMDVPMDVPLDVNLDVLPDVTLDVPPGVPLDVNPNMSNKIKELGIELSEKPIKNLSEDKDIKQLMEESDTESDIESDIESDKESDTESDKESDTESDKESDTESIKDLIEGLDKIDGSDVLGKDFQTPDYSTLTVNELKNILSEKKLPLSGNKTKLIQRIKDNM